MSVLDKVLDVFSGVGMWITEAVNSLIPMFYAEGELTVIGIMSVAGLAISVVLLLLNTIKDFLRFR